MYTGFCFKKTERRKSRGRHERKWEDNIKIDLQEVDEGHGLNSSGSG